MKAIIKKVSVNSVSVSDKKVSMSVIKKILTFILTLTLTLALLNGEAYAKELAIIGNKSYPANIPSVDSVKDIYRGEKTSEGSVKIKPIDNTEAVINKKFLEKIMGSTADAYKKYWMKRVFQEGGVPPAAKGSSNDVIQSVQGDAGSIGYVWKEEAAGKDVKILLTIDVGD